MEQTVTDVFLRTCEKFKNSAALKHKQGGNWHTLTWQDYKQEVFSVAKGLMAIGFEAKEHLAILGQNSHQWVIADVAAIVAGGIPTGIYPTSSPEQCRFIMQHCRATVVIVEDHDQLQKILEIKDSLPQLRAIVMIGGEASYPNVYSWALLKQKGREINNKQLTERIKAQKPEDVATLVYTSGTTSNPKAVMLSHHNLTWTARVVIEEELHLGNSDRILSYLPLSHIAEQMITIHGPLAMGCEIWFAESIDKLKENLSEVRPTLFLGVPRVWEKIQDAMQKKGAAGSKLQKAVGAFAKKVGLEHGQRLLQGKPGHPLFPIVDKIIFSKVRKALGLDACRIQVTAAAPISEETLNYFLSVNLPLYELYGMSECAGPTTLSLPEAYKLGKVGRAIHGAELKIASDGEILIRGPHVFKGYLHDQGATNQAVDPQGYLHSGDVGEIDHEGYLQITGRKKNIIITAGGENIAPEMLENKLKTILGVEQVVVIGDHKKYLSCLFTLSDTALAMATSVGSAAKNKKDLSKCPSFHTYLEKELEKVNKEVARVQTIKNFYILGKDFTEDGGELTPTMKIKRNIVLEKYSKEIHALY